MNVFEQLTPEDRVCNFLWRWSIRKGFAWNTSCVSFVRHKSLCAFLAIVACVSDEALTLRIAGEKAHAMAIAHHGLAMAISLHLATFEIEGAILRAAFVFANLTVVISTDGYFLGRHAQDLARIQFLVLEEGRRFVPRVSRTDPHTGFHKADRFRPNLHFGESRSLHIKV